MNYERPWRNKDGSLKNDEELKVISQQWNADTWNNYLKEYSYAEVEVLQSTNFIDRTALESFISFIADDNEEWRYPLLSKVFDEAIMKLSSKERTVILMIYKEGLTTSEVAKVIGQKTCSIKTYRKRGLKKIKDIVLRKCESSFEIREWFKSHKYPKSQSLSSFVPPSPQ